MRHGTGCARVRAQRGRSVIPVKKYSHLLRRFESHRDVHHGKRWAERRRRVITKITGLEIDIYKEDRRAGTDQPYVPIQAIGLSEDFEKNSSQRFWNAGPSSAKSFVFGRIRIPASIPLSHLFSAYTLRMKGNRLGGHQSLASGDPLSLMHLSRVSMIR
jgi:hypothetical protein